MNPVLLCDTWNRSDNNDTVSGIAILDTTAIPEMRSAISMFLRNCQSHTVVITEMCMLVVFNCLYYDKAVVCCVYCMKCAPASLNITRSQAVAKIADRTSSQHLWGSRDVIDHATIWYPICHFLLVVLWINQASFSAVSEIFNVECNTMVDMTLIWPLNKGHGHSFWYQSISHIRLLIGCQ